MYLLYARKLCILHAGCCINCKLKHMHMAIIVVGMCEQLRNLTQSHPQTPPFARERVWGHWSIFLGRAHQHYIIFLHMIMLAISNVCIVLSGKR